MNGNTMEINNNEFITSLCISLLLFLWVGIIILNIIRRHSLERTNLKMLEKKGKKQSGMNNEQSPPVSYWDESLIFYYFSTFKSRWLIWRKIFMSISFRFEKSIADNKKKRRENLIRYCSTLIFFNIFFTSAWCMIKAFNPLHFSLMRLKQHPATSWVADVTMALFTTSTTENTALFPRLADLFEFSSFNCYILFIFNIIMWMHFNF